MNTPKNEDAKAAQRPPKGKSSRLVYRKTPLGEEALKDRALLRDGHLRAMLIMVDGQATVRDLHRRLGRKHRPDDRLEQLVGMGLVEAVAAAPAVEVSPQPTADAAAPPVPDAIEVPAEVSAGADAAADMSPSAPAVSAPSIPLDIAGATTAPEPEPAVQEAPAADEESLPPAPEAATGSGTPLQAEAAPPAPPQTVPQVVPTDAPVAPPIEEVSPPEPAAAAPPPAAPSPEEAPAEAPAETAAPNEPPTPTPEAATPPREIQRLEPTFEDSGTADLEPPPPAAQWREQEPVWKEDEGFAATAPEFGRGGPPPPAPLSRYERWRLKRRARRATQAGSAKVSRRGTALKVLTVAGVSIALLLGGVAATLALKKDEIRHALEERASAVLGQPVHIEGLGLALRPRPGLRLRGVRVAQGENVSAAAVVISPALHGLGDLLRARFDLHVDAPRLQGVAVGGLCAVAGIDAETAAASRIGEILLTNLTLATSRVALEDLSGSIRLDPERGTPQVLLQDAEERLRVELSPAPHGCRFVAGGDGWRPPAAAFAALDGIRAEGTADRKGVRFDKLDARSFDGVVAGRGTLSWEPRPALDLNLELRHLELSRLLAELGVAAAARGQLDGRLHLSAAAANPRDLGKALRGSGPITISRGVIERFDLMEAARSADTPRVHGGELPFEHFSAQVEVDRSGASLSGLRIGAGALSADGAVHVKRDGSLNGALTVHLQGPGGLQKVPLNLAGSLAAPSLSVRRPAPVAADAPADGGAAPAAQ